MGYYWTCEQAAPIGSKLYCKAKSDGPLAKLITVSECKHCKSYIETLCKWLTLGTALPYCSNPSVCGGAYAVPCKGDCIHKECGLKIERSL